MLPGLTFPSVRDHDLRWIWHDSPAFNAYRGDTWMKEPCRSGIRTVHLNPSGHVKRCPDFPTDFHWRDFRRYEPVACNACYYACRGEAQAPLRFSRIADVFA